jgi:hypothetical protein
MQYPMYECHEWPTVVPSMRGTYISSFYPEETGHSSCSRGCIAAVAVAVALLV